MLDRTKDCLKEARKCFVKKYRSFHFKIAGPWLNDDSIEEIGSIRTVQILKPKTFNSAVEFLKKFGDLMPFIEIDFEEIDGNEGIEIVKYVNEKSFKSLMDFKLLNCKSNVLDGLNNTFNQVLRLKFSSSKQNELKTKENLKLNKIVPNLRYYIVEHTRSSDWKFIDGTFLKLTSLEVELQKSRDRNSVDELNILSFFNKNLQIKELKIKNTSLKLLRLLSLPWKSNQSNGVERFSNFQQLHIDGISDDYLKYKRIVHFDSIKILVVTDYEDKVPENVFFNQLETLNLRIESEFNAKWLDFVTNQTNLDLKSLKIQAKNLQIEHFLSIPDKLTHLETVFIKSDSPITAEGIANFTKKSNELKNFELNARMNEDEQKKLQESLSNDFTVKFDVKNKNKVSIIKEKRCKPDTMDTLSFAHLLLVSNLNEKCLNEARKVAANRFLNERKFIINGPLVNGTSVYETNHDIVIKSFDAIKTTFTNFGDMIHGLSIDFDAIEVEKGVQIIQLLDDVIISDTLSFIELKNCKGNVLDELEKPFKNVHCLIFSTSRTEHFQPKDDQRLSNIFPELIILAVEDTKASDWTFIDGKFNKLLSFGVSLPKTRTVNDVNETQISSFLSKNNELTGLMVNYATLKMLKEINKFVPNLPTLKINQVADDYLQYEGDIDIIEFEKVEHLFITVDDQQVIEKVVFKQVESITLEIESEFV